MVTRMTERMFQEREKPWWMNEENGAEKEETWREAWESVGCVHCLSKICPGDCKELEPDCD